MSSFQQSNDDFFNNPMASPPKQSTRLTQTRTTNKPATSTNTSRMAKRTATTTRRAPPPPPNNSKGNTAGASTATKAAGASSAASSNAKAKPARRRPNRFPAPSAQTLQPSTASNKSSNSFYSNSSNAGSASSSSSNPAGMGGTGFYSNYSAPSPAPATTASNNSGTDTTASAADNQWDSWAAPAPANATNQQQQPVNQWQATTTAASTSTQPSQPTTAAASNDWYSGASAMDTNTAPAAAASYNQWQPQPMQGSMDSNPSTMPSSSSSSQAQPSVFQPTAFFQKSGSTSNSMVEDDLENEAPLLEELGIHFDHILLKTKTVCWPFTRTSNLEQKDAMVDAVVEDADLIGPICYCLALGGEMVLTGKLQFGYIYGFGLFGCVAMTLIVNLTAPKDAVSFWVVSSVLGYALIPVNILALVKIIVINLASLQKLGRVLGLITVLWSTTASTRLLEIGCGLREQRYLIAYPIALLYSAFVLITIF